MKFLIDMNLSPRWTEVFASAGYTALHWSEAGESNTPDHEIMKFARQHDYIVLTQDLDFSAILAATNGEKPSVVQVRSGNLNPDAIGSLVTGAIAGVRDELRKGAILTVDTLRARVRILPLNIDNNDGAAE